MKTIFGSCGFRNEYESDLLRNKISCRGLKRIQACVGLELVSSVGRALYQYQRDYGFESHIGPNIFFWLYCHCCLSSVYFCKDRFHVHLSYLLLLIRQGKTGFIFQLKILLFFITLEEVHWKRQLIT